MRTNDCWNFNNLNDLLISSQAYSIITSCYYVYVCVVAFFFLAFSLFIFYFHYSFFIFMRLHYGLSMFKTIVGRLFANVTLLWIKSKLFIAFFLAPANDLELKANLIDDIKSSQTYDLCSHIVSFQSFNGFDMSQMFCFSFFIVYFKNE